MNEMKKLAVLIVLTSLFAACGGQEPRAGQPPAQQSVETPKQRAERETKELEENYRRERIERIKRQAYEAQHLYGAADELDRIPYASATEKTFGVRLSDALAVTLSYVVSEPRTYDEDFWIGRESEYRDIPEVRQRARNHTREVMVAYGLLQLGNNPLPGLEFETIVRYFYENEAQRELVYKLALPSIKKAFRSMLDEDRADYLRILRHTSAYMTKFNWKRETDYLLSLKRDGRECYSDEWGKKYYQLPSFMTTQDSYPCEILFTEYGPDGTENPYRKAEAFVFRRVAFDGWNLTEMKRILDRLIADLS